MAVLTANEQNQRNLNNLLIYQLFNAFLALNSYSMKLNYLFVLIWLHYAHSDCSVNHNCSSCIRSPDICSWCAEDNYDGNRCFSRQTVNINCNNVISETSTVKTKTDSLEFTLWPFSAVTAGIDLTSPSLHKRDKLDIYLLIDGSYSLNEISPVLSSYLTKAVGELGTSIDVRLGLGIFDDKMTAPFIEWSSVDSAKSCKGTLCGYCYSFYNVAMLNSHFSNITKRIKKLNYGRRLSASNGGFDALLQAMACKSDVGWREDNTTKVIVYFSNSLPRTAGEGQLGYILTPNDGQCHLTDSSYDDYSTKQDYPTIEDISRLSRRGNFRTLFITNSTYVDFYQQVSERIFGSNLLSFDENFFNQNGSDVTAEIKTALKKSIFSVAVDIGMNNFDLKFKCNVSDPYVHPPIFCTLMNTSSYRIFIQAQMLDSTGLKDDMEYFGELMTSGSPQRVNISIRSKLSCPCESQGKSLCFNNGIYSCGRCICDKGYVGEKCRYSENDFIMMQRHCVDPTTNTICSGAGQCIDGKCQCFDKNPINPDKYCNFDRNCPKADDKLCAGNGNCQNGKCLCNYGFSGISCSCSNKIDSCLSIQKNRPKEHLLCNGVGECVCGECECYPGSFYSGPGCLTMNKDYEMVCENYSKCVRCINAGNISCDQFCSDPESFMFWDDLDVYGCSVEAGNNCKVEFHVFMGKDRVNSVYIKHQHCESERALGEVWRCALVIALWLILGFIAIVVINFTSKKKNIGECEKFVNDRNGLVYDDPLSEYSNGSTYLSSSLDHSKLIF